MFTHILLTSDSSHPLTDWDHARIAFPLSREIARTLARHATDATVGLKSLSMNLKPKASSKYFVVVDGRKVLLPTPMLRARQQDYMELLFTISEGRIRTNNNGYTVAQGPVALSHALGVHVGFDGAVNVRADDELRATHARSSDSDAICIELPNFVKYANNNTLLDVVEHLPIVNANPDHVSVADGVYADVVIMQLSTLSQPHGFPIKATNAQLILQVNHGDNSI